MPPLAIATVDGVRLYWSAPDGFGPADYHVYRSDTVTFEGSRITRDAIAPPSALTYMDRDVQPETRYYYRINARRGPILQEMSDAVAVTTLPAARPELLGLAHPNPFYDLTRVPFHVDHDERVRISVYESAGRLVRRLTDERWPRGDHFVIWDGRDGSGRLVSAGVYFLRLEDRAARFQRKVVVFR